MKATMSPFLLAASIASFPFTSGFKSLALPKLPPAAPRPNNTFKTASEIPSPPPLDTTIDGAETPFTPSILDNGLVSAFRWTLQIQYITKEHSSLPGYDGMMQELIDYRVKHGPDELERVSYATMTALGGPVPFLWKHLGICRWESTPSILAWFAKFLLPFLVGDMMLTSRSRLDAENQDADIDDSIPDARGGGVLVKRCRVLEGSDCKGICTKMCKVPTQRFFQEQWGVPLTMTPNFATGECQLVFGEIPTPIEDDPTIPPGCLTRCSAACLMEGGGSSKKRVDSC